MNGAFDVLHIGHIKLLKYAAAMGHLRVGIDSDKRIKELKGPDRPFNSYNIRKEFLQSLRFVDEVVGFDSEEELIACIKSYRPDVMIVGSDYKDKQINLKNMLKIYYLKEKKHYCSLIYKLGKPKPKKLRLKQILHN